MGMYYMRALVKEKGLSDRFLIDSAATSREEIGNPVYPPARRKLQKEGIDCTGHRARKMVAEDYDRYDFIIGMDDENLEDMYMICEGNDPYSGGFRRRDMRNAKPKRSIDHIKDPIERRGQEICLLLDYTSRPGEVADPWYTGNFEATWRDVSEGCQAFLDYLVLNNWI